MVMMIIIDDCVTNRMRIWWLMDGTGLHLLGLTEGGVLGRETTGFSGDYEIRFTICLRAFRFNARTSSFWPHPVNAYRLDAIISWTIELCGPLYLQLP